MPTTESSLRLGTPARRNRRSPLARPLILPHGTTSWKNRATITLHIADSDALNMGHNQRNALLCRMRQREERVMPRRERAVHMLGQMLVRGSARHRGRDRVRVRERGRRRGL